MGQDKKRKKHRIHRIQGQQKASRAYCGCPVIIEYIEYNDNKKPAGPIVAVL